MSSRGPSGIANKFEIKNTGIVSDVCFLPMVSERSWQFIRLYRDYKNNIMPFAGGSFDQPNAFNEAMRIINDHS